MMELKLYQTDPYITSPDPDQILWRYIPFPAYVAMLNARAIYFSRVPVLYDDDRFEGFESESFNEAFNKKTCVNCWHQSEYESTAMWHQYGSAVAIKSTARHLIQALDRATVTNVDSKEVDVVVSLGVVRYTSNEEILSSERRASAMLPLLRKRNVFEHEREVRAIMSFYFARFDDDFRWDESYFSAGNEYLELAEAIVERPGIDVQVDLNVLIQCVVTSPTMSPWIARLVQDVTKQYGFNFPVVASELVEDPRRSRL